MALEARSEDAEAGLPALRWVPVDAIDLSALSSSVKKVHARAAGLRPNGGCSRSPWPGNAVTRRSLLQIWS